MNEQCCGTCRYYSELSGYDTGVCLWGYGTPMPVCLHDEVWAVSPSWGSDCPCWRAKETDHG